MRTIKSARRVLEMLEYFDRDHRTATVMDMSRSLNYPQSSTSELLRSLTRLGFLHYNRYRRTYSPTARVALLGSWVEPALFRGGALLHAVDEIAEAVGETVVLSTAANYVVQHLHAVEGCSHDAIVEHAGHSDPLLHCPQGRLILSSYQDAQVRLALHRINAEETDPERWVRVKDTIEECRELRQRGWLIQPVARKDGAGVVVMLLPRRKGIDRLALSVLATREVIESRGEEILKLMLAKRDEILPRERQAEAASASTVQTKPSDLDRPAISQPASPELRMRLGARQQNVHHRQVSA